MISLIICSTHTSLSEELRKNVEDTIGTEYEIVFIDNAQGNYSIFEAYNRGVHLSKGDLLCFMHEDILFHTRDWGQKCYEFFRDNQRIGMVGVAGANYIPKEVDWRLIPENLICNYIQREYTLEKSPRYHRTFLKKAHVSKANEGMSYTAVIDGMWMCIPKKMFTEEGIRFDDVVFKGFHLYDCDLCMQVNKAGYKVAVANGIQIEHFSMGDFTDSYYNDYRLFVKKWQQMLPFAADGAEVTTRSEEEVEPIRCMLLDDIAVKTAIRKRWLASNGVSLKDFPNEHRRVVEESVWKYCKVLLKSETPYKDVAVQIKASTDVLGFKQVSKLMAKFVFYRLISKSKGKKKNYFRRHG